MSESVEYLLRQKSKVQNPKSLVKVVRAHTRELKRATRREHEKAQVEALGGIAQELIRGSFDVAEKAVQAIGSGLSGFAGNPNPISQGIAIGVGIGSLAWFVASYPDAAKAIHLDALVEVLKNVSVEAKDAVEDVIDAIQPDLPIGPIGTGQFCVRVKSNVPSIFLPFQPSLVVCTDNEQLRNEEIQKLKDKLGAFAFLYSFELFTRQP